MRLNLKEDRTVKLYYLSRFLSGLRFFVPIWIIFGQKFFNVAGLGVLELITYFILIFVDIPSGALADVLGRKWIIIIGLVLLGGGHILTGYSVFPWQYVVFSIISGIGTSFISGSDTALIYDHLKESGKDVTFVKVQSFGAFAFRIGIIIATFLGGSLFNTAQFLPFLLMGVCELSSIICWLFISEPKLDSRKFSFNSYRKSIAAGVGQVIHSSYLKPLTLYYLLIGGITLSCFYFFNYSYASDLGFGGDQQSLLFGFTGIIKAIAVLSIGMFYVKFTKKRVFIGFAIAMVVFFLPAAWSGMTVAVILITVIDTLGASRIALLDKFVNEEIDSQTRATTLSFINMLINIIYMLLVGVGATWAQNHGTNNLYTIFGVISLLVILPLAFYLSSNKFSREKLSQSQSIPIAG